tara:strand:- start:47273 stop:48175 length:903 start_codon:yes stop_codon:yes gene_type:complete
MSNRHTARSVVLQTLFELDSEGVTPTRADEILANNASEFAPDTNLFPFMKQLLDTVLAKQAEIDKVIEKAAPEWPLEKIAVTDRNILRLGLSELFYADREQVPPKVAINEAIELGKEFGGESSGRFINGVLGAVYKEMGEPGKERQNKKKKEIAYEDMVVERLGGAFVYAKDETGAMYAAFVHDIFGHWTLSKGHIEAETSEEEGTKKKIHEELGLDVEIKEKIGENEYIANDPELIKKRKHVVYFLAESAFDDIRLDKDKGGLDDARWFKLSDIVDLNFYDDILPVITKAVNILAQDRS